LVTDGGTWAFSLNVTSKPETLIAKKKKKKKRKEEGKTGLLIRGLLPGRSKCSAKYGPK
jgi:hypothetical protein